MISELIFPTDNSMHRAYKLFEIDCKGREENPLTWITRSDGKQFKEDPNLIQTQQDKNQEKLQTDQDLQYAK